LRELDIAFIFRDDNVEVIAQNLDLHFLSLTKLKLTNIRNKDVVQVT